MTFLPMSESPGTSEIIRRENAKHDAEIESRDVTVHGDPEMSPGALVRAAAAGVRRDLIRSVIAQQEQEWDSEGDAWLFHPNPDEAYLLVDALADAIEAALGQKGSDSD